MAVSPPPGKKRFVPFQLETGRAADPDVINRNFRKIEDFSSQLSQELQLRFVQIPGSVSTPQVRSQSWNAGDQQVDSSGNEVVLYEFLADFTAAPSGLLTANFSCLASSLSGVAKLFLRVGGSWSNIGDAATGNVVASNTRNGTTLAPVKLIGQFTNPGGAAVPIHISAKSSAAGSAFKVTVRRVAGVWTS